MMQMQRPARDFESGMTLLEMIVVLAIIAIVAGLIVPNVIGRPDEARVTVAKSDMLSISAALKMYRLDNGFYPTGAQGLSALVQKPTQAPQPANWSASGYLDTLPVDPWNRPYTYSAPAREGAFELSTFGADGEPGGEGPAADLHHVQR